MLALVDEEQLLRRAVSEGLISQDDLREAATGSVTGPLRWGQRIDLLVRRGLLSEPDVERLTAMVMQKSGGPAATAPSLNAASPQAPEPRSARASGNPALADTLAGDEPAAPARAAASISGFPFPHWDRYEFLEILGRGGMGAVYKARDRQLGRIVALKFIRDDDAGMTGRFMQEARAQARLDHPSICKVYEVGTVDGRPYIAMEFIDGLPLDRCSASMSLLEKLQVMQATAAALHAAHEHGVIHRDIKPSNILIERRPDGSRRPVLMDFGLAREAGSEKGLTESGAVMGTPAYMSPEQARGDARHLDRRSDVYSLGATLYDVLSGQPPFDDETVVRILLKVMNDTARPLRSRDAAIPEAVELIVGKCLNKEPEQRYPTALALAEDLGRFLAAQRVTARRLGTLYRLRYWARRNPALATVGGLLLCSLLGLAGFGVRTRIVNAQRERAAQQEAELAERLGQEIKDMEWMLRSARQMPLHDLGREKAIVRQRMARQKTWLSSAGGTGPRLVHYALGRAHMALHEYPQALVELQQAMQAGRATAELHYALGFVLGKHFEQALYEARLSGGGDWARKQLKAIELRFLVPAIESLQHSRAMRSDAPQYLEGLIAFYQRDYEGALRHAAAALQQAPWLYEASKLAGDVHLERALQLRDAGRYEAAEAEFRAAVGSYQEASAVGQSDGEVYEGLAESWVRQIEMALRRGQPTEAAYTAAISASDKASAAEPQSLGGPLKRAYAALMTMALSWSGMSSEDRVKKCLAAAEAVLSRQPEHPYASDVAAGCTAFAAERAQAQGQDPEPLLRRALAVLEPTLQRYPNFLWGLNDLANIYAALGVRLQLRGSTEAASYLRKCITYYEKALALEPAYLNTIENLLDAYSRLIPLLTAPSELAETLAAADSGYARCAAINRQSQPCQNNYLLVNAQAALRLSLTGQDPRPRLALALKSLDEARRLGGPFLDTEQSAAVAYLVDAESRVRERRDPGPALAQLQAALKRCFQVAEQDALCKILDAQQEWPAAEWLALHAAPAPAPVSDALQRALKKAQIATQLHARNPDAWRTLARTYLLLARAPAVLPAERARDIAGGLDALTSVFAINPSHALARVTQGELLLLQAKTEARPSERRREAQSAAESLQLALKSDPLLQREVAPLLAQATALTAAP